MCDSNYKAPFGAFCVWRFADVIQIFPSIQPGQSVTLTEIIGGGRGSLSIRRSNLPQRMLVFAPARFLPPALPPTAARDGIGSKKEDMDG